eukprot:772261-Pelagomonas_calceolata.AAC.2
MGREPLALSPSGKVHTWLHWPTQRTPRPEIWHAGQSKSCRQHCSVNWEWGTPWAKCFETSLLGRCAEHGQHDLPRAPRALKLGMLNNQKVPSGT